MALNLTVEIIAILFHVSLMTANGGRVVRIHLGLPVMVGGTWILRSQRQQLKSGIKGKKDGQKGTGKTDHNDS